MLVLILFSNMEDFGDWTRTVPLDWMEASLEWLQDRTGLEKMERMSLNNIFINFPEEERHV